VKAEAIDLPELVPKLCSPRWCWAGSGESAAICSPISWSLATWAPFTTPAPHNPRINYVISARRLTRMERKRHGRCRCHKPTTTCEAPPYLPHVSRRRWCCWWPAQQQHLAQKEHGVAKQNQKQKIESSVQPNSCRVVLETNTDVGRVTLWSPRLQRRVGLRGRWRSMLTRSYIIATQDGVGEHWCNSTRLW